MAAEKLTKRRLIQICFVLGVLLFMFFWRTFEYSEKNEIKKEAFFESENINKVEKQ